MYRFEIFGGRLLGPESPSSDERVVDILADLSSFYFHDVLHRLELPLDLLLNEGSCQARKLPANVGLILLKVAGPFPV